MQSRWTKTPEGVDPRIVEQWSRSSTGSFAPGCRSPRAVRADRARRSRAAGRGSPSEDRPPAIAFREMSDRRAPSQCRARFRVASKDRGAQDSALSRSKIAFVSAALSCRVLGNEAVQFDVACVVAMNRSAQVDGTFGGRTRHGFRSRRHRPTESHPRLPCASHSGRRSKKRARDAHQM